MSRKTKFAEPFYRSQASHERCDLHSPNRLYVSGANAISPSKLSQKIMHQNTCNSPRMGSKYERTIDGITTATNYKKPSSQKQSLYTRQRYIQDVRWQSPMKNSQKKECFKSIIEEINQNNDKALEQLDDDIRRIKNNLVKAQEQKAIDKKNSQNELLFEEIQLLQEENERLRTKNLEMIQQKKKLTQTIDKYQAFIQQQRQKQITTFSVRNANQQKSVEEFLSQKQHNQQKLRQKQIQNQRLRFQLEKLTKSLDSSSRNKRQIIQAEQITRLNKKIQELQRQLANTTISFQESLKSQLQKKDKHYLNLLEITRSKSQESLKKIQSSCKSQLNAQNEGLLKIKERQCAKLKDQMILVGKKEEQLRKKLQKYQSEVSQLRSKVQLLNNQNQFITFNCRQVNERLAEKDQQKGQIQAKLNSLQGQLKKIKAEYESIDLKWQQQKKRYFLLQQLYNRLEKQSQSLDSDAQNHLHCYKKAVCDYQQQLNQSKYEIDCLRKNYQQLQQQLEESIKQNQKLVLQNQNRNEEILSLKKEKMILLNSRDSLVKVQEQLSPPKYVMRQRFLSGQPKPSTMLTKEREKEKEKMMQYKKLQKQLYNMVQDIRLQKQKDRNIFKQKEKGLKVSIKNQKKITDELNLKFQSLKNESEKLKMQKLLKQQELVQALKKKEAAIMKSQLKTNEIQLKLAKLQNQAKNHKQIIEQNKMSFANNESKLKRQLDEKNKEFKEKFSSFLQNVMKQLKRVDDASFQMSVPKTFTFYGQDLGDFSSLFDFRRLSEFNSTIDKLNQKFVHLMKKVKQLQKKYQEKCDFQYYKSNPLNQREFHPKFYQNNLHSKEQKNEEIQGLEQQVKELSQKINKLQTQNQKLTASYKQLNLQLQQNLGVVRQQKKEIGNLIDKNEELLKQLYISQHKLNQKEFQILLQTQREKLKIQGEKVVNQQLTPKKQMPFIQKYQPQPSRQSQKLLDSRTDLTKRGFLAEKKSATKYSQNNIDKQKERRIIQLQMMKMNYQNQLQKQRQKFQALSEVKDCIQRKFKKLNEKYQQNLQITQKLVKEVEALRKRLLKNEQKIQNYEKEAKVLVVQLESLNQRYLYQTQRHKIETQEKELNIKELVSENQSLVRKNKKQWAQKDTQLINSTQKYELKIVELQSEIVGLKQKATHLKSEYQSLEIKHQKTVHLLQCNISKIQEKQNMIKQLSQKLEIQRNEKQKIFSMFTLNTSQLSKLLEAKQIEIEQLKFIQESTIINYHCQRNALNSRRKNQSAYSFQEQL